MPATAPLRHLKECRRGKCNTGEIPHATLRKSICIFEEKVLAKNRHSTKTLKSQYGEFQIEVPRDRNGEFEPKLVPKYQRDISGIEEKVIFLYAWWMSTRDLNCRYWITLKIITSRGSIHMTIWHKALQLFHDFYYDISFLSYISSSVTKRTSLCVCA